MPASNVVVTYQRLSTHNWSYLITSTPNAAAMPSIVTSSSVGPTPPLVITACRRTHTVDNHATASAPPLPSALDVEYAVGDASLFNNSCYCGVCCRRGKLMITVTSQQHAVAIGLECCPDKLPSDTQQQWAASCGTVESAQSNQGWAPSAYLTACRHGGNLLCNGSNVIRHNGNLHAAAIRNTDRSKTRTLLVCVHWCDRQFLCQQKCAAQHSICREHSH